MKTNERLRRIAIAAYTLPFVIRLALSLMRPLDRDLPEMLILAIVALTPALLYFCGVRWCRYVVGAFSVLFLLLWLTLPIALHAIDRTDSFWLIWWGGVLVFIFSSIMSFTHIARENHAA